jgi:hypothetical protein
MIGKECLKTEYSHGFKSARRSIGQTVAVMTEAEVAKGFLFVRLCAFNVKKHCFTSAQMASLDICLLRWIHRILLISISKTIPSAMSVNLCSIIAISKLRQLFFGEDGHFVDDS